MIFRRINLIKNIFFSLRILNQTSLVFLINTVFSVNSNLIPIKISPYKFYYIEILFVRRFFLFNFYLFVCNYIISNENISLFLFFLCGDITAKSI